MISLFPIVLRHSAASFCRYYFFAVLKLGCHTTRLNNLMISTVVKCFMQLLCSLLNRVVGKEEECKTVGRLNDLIITII